MSFAWLSFYYLTDEEYKQAVADRKAHAEKVTTAGLPQHR